MIPGLSQAGGSSVSRLCMAGCLSLLYRGSRDGLRFPKAARRPGSPRCSAVCFEDHCHLPPPLLWKARRKKMTTPLLGVGPRKQASEEFSEGYMLLRHNHIFESPSLVLQLHFMIWSQALKILFPTLTSVSFCILIKWNKRRHCHCVSCI